MSHDPPDLAGIAAGPASYGDCGLVHFGAGAQGFIDAVEAAQAGPAARSPAFCARADALLHDRSWNRSVAEMHALIKQCMAAPALTAAAA